MKLEVLNYDVANNNINLLFVHGTNHGAWCWEVYFLPYFKSMGISSYAINLRGHGLSEGRDSINKFTLDDYVKDVVSVLKQFKNKPVLVGHSMGGIIAQKILTYNPELIRGVILMSSISFKGSKTEILRFIKNNFKQFILLNTNSEKSINKISMNLYLSENIDEEKKKYFKKLLQIESRSANQNCFSINELLTNSKGLPMLVIGSYKDKVISWKTAKELMSYYKCSGEIFENSGHDMMLDIEWKEVANLIYDFIMEI